MFQLTLHSLGSTFMSIAFFLCAPLSSSRAQESSVALSLPIAIAPVVGTEYNLVLFLYNPPGGATVVERAAITRGNRNGIGTEIQELEQMRGQQFYKSTFRVEKNWLKDVDLDGYSDLLLPISVRGAKEAFAVFLFNPKRNRFEFLSEYSGEPDTPTNVAFEYRAYTRQTGNRH